MDKMESYEVQDYIDNIEYLDVSSWEQTRFIMYSVFQIMSKKKLSVKDILEFSWEKSRDHNIEEHDTSISDEDIARLSALSKQFEKSKMKD